MHDKFIEEGEKIDREEHNAPEQAFPLCARIQQILDE
jgi:hypothetical protein